MKFSEAWLRSLIEPAPELDSQALAERLTMLGLEVDSLEPAGTIDQRVVAGEILSVQSVAGDERLRWCSVALGEGTASLRVLCGAPNLRQGMKVAVAQAGAQILAGTVARKEIRGMVSEAVLVAESEIGLGDRADVIMELDADAKPGQTLQQVLDLDDVCIGLDLTPDRGDCFSMLGIARDLAAFLGARMVMPAWQSRDAALEDRIEVTIEAPQACASFYACVARDLREDCLSPLWLRERLRRAGVRCIHPVVDITNYVMIEFGRPLHAFDRAKLQGGIVVRGGRQGERLALLDGREQALDAEALAVCDHKVPLALAGIMGDSRSGVTSGTRDVVIECAWFNPLRLGRTARRFGIQTDASLRFERGVDPELSELAMDRARQLLVEVCGAKLGPVTRAVSPEHLPRQASIRLRRKQIRRLVGRDIKPRFVEDGLSRLGFALESSQQGTWRAKVPSHRFDIEGEADLVEEVARLHGFDQVPEVHSQGIRCSPRRIRQSRSLREFVAALGYREIISYSFMAKDWVDRFGSDSEPVCLLNPMSSDQAAMRNSLIPGLLRSLVANVSRQHSRVRIFELGRVFLGRDADVRNQPLRIAALHYGNRLPESWEADPQGVDFFDMKGDVERILDYCGSAAVRWERASEAFCYPGRSARVELHGHPVGLVGELHPNAARTLDIDANVCFFELEVAPIVRRELAEFREPSRFPQVRRDLAMLVGRELPAASIEDLVKLSGGEMLSEVGVFDVYQGKGVGASDKSVAIRLLFQAAGRTLRDEEVSSRVQLIIDELRSNLGARLRGD